MYGKNTEDVILRSDYIEVEKANRCGFIGGPKNKLYGRSGVHGSDRFTIVSVCWFISPIFMGQIPTYSYRGYNPVTKYHGHPSRVSNVTTPTSTPSQN